MGSSSALRRAQSLPSKAAQSWAREGSDSGSTGGWSDQVTQVSTTLSTSYLEASLVEDKV